MATLTCIALAQTDIGVEIPEGSSMTLSATAFRFDLSGSDYPPPEFPAYYLPVAVDEGTGAAREDGAELRVFSNVGGNWRVAIGFDGLRTAAGDLLPPDRLEYRLGGGPWRAFAPSTTLLTGSGQTLGYEEARLELRLRLEGDERPGSYRGTLIFTLGEF